MGGVRWREADRLAALREYRILDTPPEPAFDDLVRWAARACGAPVSLLSLVGARRQWFKAEVGLSVQQVPLRPICKRTVLQPGLTVVHDLTQDPRFGTSPLVTGKPPVRFYAGVVLATPEGLPLGTLCILDHRPRALSEEEGLTLQGLARQAMALLNLRRAALDRDEALEASRRAEHRQALLVRELHHRVRNTLAVVQALLGATARRSGSVDEFYQSFSDRIASMAKTHALVTEDVWQTASLRDMALGELAPFAEADRPRIKLVGPPVELPADLAVPLGLALHELTTNAAKFGALSVNPGDVEMTWDVEQAEDGRRKLCLEWVERGGPPVQVPVHQGFGSTLLHKVLPRQAHAAVDVRFNSDGVRCRIEAPLGEQQPTESVRPAAR